MSDKPIDPQLAAAKARAAAARTRLFDTIGTLQGRARPRSLAHDVGETVKKRGIGALAELARKPARTGAAMTALGLFFARHQIIRLVRNATSSKPKS